MVALTTVVTMDKETWSHDVTPLPMDLFEKQLESGDFNWSRSLLKLAC